MLILTSRRFVVRTLTAALAALASSRPASSQQAAATSPRVLVLAVDMPHMVRVPGPHGIPLVAHAKAGGPAAMAVLDYITTVMAQLDRRE